MKNIVLSLAFATAFVANANALEEVPSAPDMDFEMPVAAPVEGELPMAPGMDMDSMPVDAEIPPAPDMNMMMDDEAEAPAQMDEQVLMGEDGEELPMAPGLELMVDMGVAEMDEMALDLRASLWQRLVEYLDQEGDLDVAGEMVSKAIDADEFAEQGEGVSKETMHAILKSIMVEEKVIQDHGEYEEMDIELIDPVEPVDMDK